MKTGPPDSSNSMFPTIFFVGARDFGMVTTDSWRPHVRLLRLVLMDRTEHGARLLADHGIAWTKPAGVSAVLKAMGYDGLALDGGEAGFHLVLNDGALVRL